MRVIGSLTSTEGKSRGGVGYRFGLGTVPDYDCAGENFSSGLCEPILALFILSIRTPQTYWSFGRRDQRTGERLSWPRPLERFAAALLQLGREVGAREVVQFLP